MRRRRVARRRLNGELKKGTRRCFTSWFERANLSAAKIRGAGSSFADIKIADGRLCAGIEETSCSVRTGTDTVSGSRDWSYRLTANVVSTSGFDFSRYGI
jgi:hypothetical protein